jgi:hypothetical protein
MEDQRELRRQADPGAGAQGRGFTRLYRVEPIPGGREWAEWEKITREELGIARAEGRWFVADPSLLDWYREDAIGPTRTVYVDVPTDDLERYRVSNSTEQYGHRPVRSYSRDPENEFFLPRELADQKRELSISFEPLLSGGMTRLYHGGHGPIEESRWFTSNRPHAEGYAAKSGGEVFYVDLPTDHPLIEPEWPDQSVARGFTWICELPEDLARQARPIGTPRADRGAGSGVYQVWHDAGWPERASLNARFGVETPFPQGFIHVADVEAANLGQAVALTGGAGYLPGPGGVSWEPWEMNPGVRALAPLPQTRDTDAGDVIVDPQGRAHRYDGLGFRAIAAEDRPLPTPADIADGHPGPHAPVSERGMGRAR